MLGSKELSHFQLQLYNHTYASKYLKILSMAFYAFLTQDVMQNTFARPPDSSQPGVPLASLVALFVALW